jgi:DNA topoisomerase-1
VTHDGVNATLPNEKTPDTITLDEAVALLEERIAKGGGKRPAKKAAKKSDGDGKRASTARRASPRKAAAKPAAKGPSAKAKSASKVKAAE